MTTFDSHLGRRHAIGLGIEGTPGSAVAPQEWLWWYDNDFQTKVGIVENESAIGVDDRVNDSDTSEIWGEGKIGGKVTATSIGYLLLGVFGSVVTADNGDGTYTHSFKLRNQADTTQTITTVDPGGANRYAGGKFENIEITAQQSDWVMATVSGKGQAPVTASDTPALTAETEFTSKHVTFEVADNLAGLDGSTSVVKVKSVTHTLDRAADSDFSLGDYDKPDFDRGEFEPKGEFVLKYRTTDMSADYLTNASHAVRTTIENGTDKLVVTGSKVRFRELDINRDRSKTVVQTVSTYYEYDTTAGSSILIELTNNKASYAAA